MNNETLLSEFIYILLTVAILISTQNANVLIKSKEINMCYHKPGMEAGND